jgi:hypothetical protein
LQHATDIVCLRTAVQGECCRHDECDGHQ